MTDIEKETTNAATARLATQTGVLPLRSLQLIGVTGPADNRRALLRTAGGQIQAVRTGDQLRQGRVVAISDSAVLLDAATGPRRLHMPTSSRPRAAA